MIRRETDFPLISYDIAEVAPDTAPSSEPDARFRFTVLVALNRRRLRSEEYVLQPPPDDRDTIRIWLGTKADLSESKRRESWLRDDMRRELFEEQRNRSLELEKSFQQLNARIPTLQSIARIFQLPVSLRFSDLSTARTYVLHKGTLWSSRKNLNETEWKFLITALLDSETAKLAQCDSTRQSCSRREAIPAQVRIAVWRRDQGKCARCGSRNRLEYDHIIPVALGGSNTERNIELLCEACNRAKCAAVALP